MERFGPLQYYRPAIFSPVLDGYSLVEHLHSDKKRQRWLPYTFLVANGRTFAAMGCETDSIRLACSADELPVA